MNDFLKEWNIYLIRFKYTEYFLSVENKRDLWITYEWISMETFSNMKWIFRNYLFEDKLKWIVEIIYAWIFWNINSLWNLYVKAEICLKINIDLFLKCWNYISYKDILENK